MSYSSEVLADSPLLYWRLGEASGTTATDSSGNGRHGTYSGSPTMGVAGLLTGDANTAVTFDGIDDEISFADTTDLTSFTVEMWAKTNNAAFQYLAARWSTTSASNQQIFSVNITGAGKLSAVIRLGSTNAIFTGSATVNDNARHHLAVVFDNATDTLTLYVDGVSDGGGTASGNLSTFDSPFTVGRRGDTTSSRFIGTLDEVAYYATALSATRVAAHYTAGTASGGSSQTITPGHIASSATVYGPTVTPGAVTVTPDHLASSTAVYAPTLLTTDIVTPDFIATSGTVYDPTVALLGTTVTSGFIATASTTFSPTLLVAGQRNICAQGVLPPLVADVQIDRAGQPEINRAGAWVRDNIGEALWTPAVVASPFAQPKAVVRAQAFTAPTITGTHTQITPTYATEPAHRDRLVVGGKDITFWRNIPTPTPDFQWVQPLGYGAATFELPQAVIPFETPGEGELSWCRKGAKVVIQRVDPDTGAIIATDWRGVIVAFDLSGNRLTVECGGDAVGRAALQDRQMQLIQRRMDAGRMVALALRNLKLRHQPALGATTGINLIRWGGGGQLDYINELVSKMTTLEGDQWTVMPDANGVYRTTLKDLDTIHGTVYLDDARVKGDLRSDMSEEPNRIFASGVTPEGMVVKFGAYPGLVQAAAPPYPFDDNRTFGPGTTDADTDTGDGVTVMGWRLHVAGYLDARLNYSDYDAEVAEAIRDLKREAKLFVSGNMTPAAWDALFDLSVTGYSLSNIRILPAAATDEVTSWRRSANGSLIARNPDYDPSVIPVDRTLAMGAGFTRNQIRRWARRELATASSWRGTIEITTGAIVAGDHTPGTPIATILRARDIRPGMNLSLPLFAGGIVVHVAGVSVTDQGRNVLLAVDTRPGDTLPVWAAIQRDRENRDTVHRAFTRQRRAASLERENTFDEVGGRVSPLALDAGWNVFPVVAKQAGTIQRLAMEVNPSREFVVAVFGRRISKATLRAVTNAPLTVSGSKRWTDEGISRRLIRDHAMLYVAGSDENPCGYSPGRKSDGASLLTGRFEDDASFPFVTYVNDTDRGSVLWVAVWVGSTTTLQGGRIMWPSPEDY